LYLVCAIDWAILFGLLYGISNGWIIHSVSEFVLYAICYGVASGIHGSVGHELIHYKEKIHVVFGYLAYFKILYS
jgi:hypothetical protein